ncbi:MAG: SLC13 family permease [Acidobacteriaceae bacterium]|nr:SLC13 family permease [Acidobacteriaceae bacterium]
MPTQAWLSLILLVSMFALMAWDKLPTWVVFLAALTVAMTLHLAPPSGLLKGFSNAGVLTVAALFPVATGMYSTGAISLLSQRVIGHPKTEISANLRILPLIAIGSAFINNTPMVAMMIPVVRDLRRQAGLAAPSLLMGISFASILGGNTTLIGGAVNLIVAGMTVDAIRAGKLPGVKPIGMFDLSWVGVPAAVVGLLYLVYVAPRLLRGVKSDAVTTVPKHKYLSEFQVLPNSNLDGKTIGAAELTPSAARQLRSVCRDGAKLTYSPELILRGGDKLTFTSSAEMLCGLWTTIGLIPARGTAMNSARHQHQLVEVVVSGKARAIGHRLSDLPLPESPYQIMLVGLSRNGDAPAEELDDLRVEPGDAAVLEVNDCFFYENRRESDFLVTKTLEGNTIKHVDRAIIATVITVAMVVLAASGVITLLNAALLATFGMLLTGCLTSDQAWRSIQWKTIAVLGAALGLESAITASGLSATIAQICASLGGSSPKIALAIVFVGTIVMTNLISNSATAAFMFPVALSMSETLRVNFKPFAVIIMIAASCAFVNPAGFQTNLMVQKDGGYGFVDFAKLGTPLTLIVGTIVLLLAPIVYGF